jgi:hypothetical protein
MAQALRLHRLGLLEALRGCNAGRLLQGLQRLPSASRAAVRRRTGEVGAVVGRSDCAWTPVKRAIASSTAMAVVVRILRACIGVSCLDQARA